jgi:hypothetical protein
MTPGGKMTVAEVVAAEEKLADDLGHYEGKWVAIFHHKVVADSASLDDLLKKTKEEDIPVDSVLQVMQDDNTVCLF